MNLINETIKALTESDADTVTEYTITFNDGELYDEYDGEFISEDKSETDDLFNEIKENGQINQVFQYYAKTWEMDEDGNYLEGDTEVYYTEGDPLEESNKLTEKLVAYDIQWETDYEEDKDNLPTEIEIPDNITEESDITEYLSNVTGYLHNGYKLKTESIEDGVQESNDIKTISLSEARQRCKEAQDLLQKELPEYDWLVIIAALQIIVSDLNTKSDFRYTKKRAWGKAQSKVEEIFSQVFNTKITLDFYDSDVWSKHKAIVRGVEIIVDKVQEDITDKTFHYIAKCKLEGLDKDEEADKVVYDSEDPIENMWTAVCVGDNEYIKKAYDSEEIKPGTRIVLFGEPVSFIMGALRNKNWETVELLKSYGETILKAEVDEYKRIMAEKVYEDDITRTAKDESITTDIKECSTCITESKTLATTPDKGSIMKITSSDFTEEMKQKYPNAAYALVSDKQAPNGDLYTMLYDNTDKQIGIYTFEYDIPQELKDLKESILNITDNIIDMINEKSQITSEELNQYIKQVSSTIPNRKYIEGGLRTHIINNLLKTSNIKYDTRQQIFYTK